MIYHTCPHCGAHLDPGEVCDCRQALEAEARSFFNRLSAEQIATIVDEMEKAPANSAKAGEGRVEKVLPGSNSTSIVR